MTINLTDKEGCILSLLLRPNMKDKLTYIKYVKRPLLSCFLLFDPNNPAESQINEKSEAHRSQVSCKVHLAL